MTNTKVDEEVLFSKVEISGIEVKPWSFGTLFDLSNLLEIVLDKAEKKGVLKAVEDALESGVFSYILLVRLFTLASDEMLDILAITCKVEDSIIRNLGIDDGVKLAYTVFHQNSTIIKNAFSLASIVIQNEKDEGKSKPS